MIEGPDRVFINPTKAPGRKFTMILLLLASSERLLGDGQCVRSYIKICVLIFD